ncbi:sulfate permease [Annulohypoxylon maeteangense]|uniref:sulfate permease n=1 Tax=Annulohypoxylon maeteangense TaxID=1927788 RepID=UPI002007576D|nr:sulfate permease [Annulohypoxylon maeteangense]KAI0881740.1 sulfate permease [Annulohypoxylon maeteangense]
MSSTRTKIGHGLAWFFNLNLDPYGQREAELNDSRNASQSHPDVEPYDEKDPTAISWIVSITPTPRGIFQYFYRLFPFLHWITRYNLTWFIGDLIAGVTVGAVVVPQGMAYALLAELEPQYGLYSSFMGVLLYWFFATSKDITIGPVAVMSTVTGGIVNRAEAAIPDIPGHVVASSLAVIVGAIVCFLGLARLGWIVDLIPLPSIAAFMTGSGISIAVGQIPTMMGMNSKKKRFSTRDATYLVIINTLKNLKYTTIDAAMGLTALLMLYIIRGTCTFLAKKYPHREKTLFFINTLRTAFVILLYTGISAGVNVYRRTHPLFSVLGEVPRGFQHAGVPNLDPKILSFFTSELPAAVIVVLIEHISISKSFGRVNNYVIDPSQELVAIGVSNLLGPFLGAYPATGSFSRTAIKAKSGVRTPFAGVITAIVVLLAIYALTAVFWYIPQASLAAVIIHAVLDVVSPPNVVYQFWRVSPLEVIIFFAGVLVTLFDTIEDGIYTTVCISFAVFIFRMFQAKGRFLGIAKVRTVGDLRSSRRTSQSSHGQKTTSIVRQGEISSERNLFIPIDHDDNSNPRVSVEHPYPGVFIYQFSELFNYPNATRFLDGLTAGIFKQTRRTDPGSLGKLGDRPWNNPGPRKGKVVVDDTEERPTLRAIILDCSAVNNVDVTSVQALIDVRNQLDRYAQPDIVEWHFANVRNRWTRRALTAAGFGFLQPKGDAETGYRWKSIFSVADLADAASPLSSEKASVGKRVSGDEEIGSKPTSTNETEGTVRQLPLYGLNRPFFHADVQEALDAVLENVEHRPSLFKA